MRSFFIQSSWNYQRMIGLGFCSSLIPIARRLCPDERSLRAFLERHCEFFNAHPLFASWALGAAARIEEQAVRENWPDDRPIRIFKKRLCGPLGAIGDRLIWSLVKPLASVVGVTLALTISVLAVPIFLLIYNLPLVIYRVHAIDKGYSLGFDIVREMSLRRYAKQEKWLVTTGLAVTGIFLAIAVREATAVSSFFAALAMGLVLFRLRMRAAIVLSAGLALALLLGWFSQAVGSS